MASIPFISDGSYLVQSRECSEPHLLREISFYQTMREKELKLYKDFMIDIKLTIDKLQGVRI